MCFPPQNREKLQQTSDILSLEFSELELQYLLVLIYKGELEIPTESFQSFLKIVNLCSIKIITPTLNNETATKRKNKLQVSKQIALGRSPRSIG